VAVFPFLWTLWGSFKVQGDFFSKADWEMPFMGSAHWLRLAVPLQEMVTAAPGLSTNSGGQQ